MLADEHPELSSDGSDTDGLAYALKKVGALEGWLDILWLLLGAYMVFFMQVCAGTHRERALFMYRRGLVGLSSRFTHRHTMRYDPVDSPARIANRQH